MKCTYAGEASAAWPLLTGVVARDLERAQQQRAEGLAGGRPLAHDRLEQLGLPRHGARGRGALGALRQRRDRQAERGQAIGQRQQRLVLRVLVDAVERRAAGSREHAPHRLVREQHELLDERVRARLLVPAGVRDAAVVDLERELARGQREGAAGVAPGTQVTGQRVRACEQVALRMVQPAREDLLRLVVGQPRAAADQRAAHVRCARACRRRRCAPRRVTTRRTSPGRRLQAPAESSSGSIGSTEPGT